MLLSRCHGVHVVRAELVSGRFADALVAPLHVGRIDRIDSVTGRRPVDADGPVGKESAPPPCFADGGRVVFDHFVVDDHRGVVVRMPRYEMHLGEIPDGIHQRPGFHPWRSASWPCWRTRRCNFFVELDMQTEPPAAQVFILDGSQVFGQPGHLRQRHDAVVVAAAQHAVAAARIDPVNVVEYHVVHLAEVERIVVRPQRPAIGKLPRGVAPAHRGRYRGCPSRGIRARNIRSGKATAGSAEAGNYGRTNTCPRSCRPP